MAFNKFRLGATKERPSPVPIAAAVCQPPSRGQEASVQHPSNDKNSAFQKDRSKQIIYPKSSSSTNDPRVRCNKRDTHKLRGTTCVECRNSKSRCQNNSTGVGRCLRCLQKNKQCTVYLPSQIASADDSTTLANSHPLSNQLQVQQPLSKTSLSDHHCTERRLEIDSNLDMHASPAIQQKVAQPTSTSLQLSCSGSDQIGHMAKYIFSSKITEEIFHRYLDIFAPKCPIVVFPAGTTAELVQETKPLLFLSIMSIASAGYCTITQQRDLANKVRLYLAERAVVRGEKSIELVQALQIVSFWYRAPDDYKQMNLNQLASIATTMAIDLGLDRIEVSKPTSSDNEMWDRAEAQRVWLGCLLLSASLSLILRRPNSLAWNSQYDDYAADLRRTKTSPTDEFLCLIVKTECICHAVNQELSLSDSTTLASLSDLNTLSKVQKFKTQIECLPLEQVPSLKKSLAEFGRFASLLYAHELVLHVNHNIDEFRAPFSVKSLETCNFINMHDLHPSRIFMLRTIIQAAQGLLDVFLKLSTSDMIALPPHIYGGRVIYAVVLLLKLHKALRSSGRAISEYVTADELRLEVYIEHLVLVSRSLIAKDDRSALSRAFLVMPQLSQWLHTYQSKSRPPSDSDKIEMMEGIPFLAEDRLSSTAIQTPTAALSDPSVHVQTPTITHLGPLNGFGQSNVPLQPSKASDNPVVHNGGSGLEQNRHELASDSWFWEFFNVEMLHQNAHSS
ncbi:hypothetical protein PENCOP_c005G06503 [Penicillium coprophilum]|uniref:Zn(2)-C6 fungal-type domain-containing protein n=1 Tax=Penicillium coprophilum TaxID=36646 RepID=A0A1V6USN4_9EURO|nr:hypothetical protein PENCOP_c005G06503 [Penicillium coprophilum]